MNWKRLLRNSPALSGYSLLIGAILLNLLVQGTQFFSRDTISSIITGATPLILVAIAQTVIVLAGGIDLSVGSTVTLVNAVAIVLASQQDWPIVTAWATALAVGTLVGLVNGVIVSYLRVTPLLATFASSSVITGIALIILPKPGGSVPREIYRTYGDYLFGLPTPLWVILFVLVVWWLATRFPTGRYIRAVGGNERSAYATGINTARVRLFAYMLGGFITGVAGLAVTAQTASGDPRIGIPFTLNSIAAIILGGTVLTGGWGSVPGSVAGALFLNLVSNIVFYAFNHAVENIPNFNVTTYYQQLLSNFIVVFGLASSVITSRREKAAQRQAPKPQEGLPG